MESAASRSFLLRFCNLQTAMSTKKGMKCCNRVSSVVEAGSINIDITA